MSATPNFLPFTKPTVDEETISAVADVLRSGWLTSPRVKEFEAQLTEYILVVALFVLLTQAPAPWRLLCVSLVSALEMRSLLRRILGLPLQMWSSKLVLRPVFVDIDPKTTILI